MLGAVDISSNGKTIITGSFNYPQDGNREGLARVHRFDQVLPELSIKFSVDSLTENFQKAVGTVTIDKSFDYDVYAILEYSGTAQLSGYDTDYTYSHDTVIISSGKTSASFIIETLLDPITDNNESIVVTISSSINAKINLLSSSKTLIITDIQNSYTNCDNLDYNLGQFEGQPGYNNYVTTLTDGKKVNETSMDLFRISDYDWVSNYDPNINYWYSNKIYGWKNKSGCSVESYYHSGWKTRCRSFNDNLIITILKYKAMEQGTEIATIVLQIIIYQKILMG